MKNTGYTLIEVMVSSLLIIMVVGGGVAAYRNFEQRQAIVNGGRELAVILRETQKRAQSGEKPADCDSVQLNGWEVVKTSSSEDIVIRAICNNLAVPASQETYSLPDGVSYEQTNFNFTFQVLSGKVSDPMTLRLNNSLGNRTYLIELTGAGGIIESGVN